MRIPLKLSLPFSKTFEFLSTILLKLFFMKFNFKLLLSKSSILKKPILPSPSNIIKFSLCWVNYPTGFLSLYCQGFDKAK